MKVRPLHDWMVIELEPAPTHKGCIIVPDPDKEPLRIGKVLAVGQGVKNPKRNVVRPTRVKVGDRVAFPMAVTQCGSGKNITHHLDDGHRMIREEDVFFIVEGDVCVEV
jgi:co-chaperonin GroES (HSP10)